MTDAEKQAAYRQHRLTWQAAYRRLYELPPAPPMGRGGASGRQGAL